MRLKGLEVLAIVVARSFAHLGGDVADHEFWRRMFYDDKRLIEMVDAYNRRRELERNAR